VAKYPIASVLELSNTLTQRARFWRRWLMRPSSATPAAALRGWDATNSDRGEDDEF